MKLLFDQNISFRVVKNLQEKFPGAKHINELPETALSDKEIWNFAKSNEFSIVTFDADFNDLVTLYGHPPKIIWLRLGNTTSQSIVQIFNIHFEVIKSFLKDDTHKQVGCLLIER